MSAKMLEKSMSIVSNYSDRKINSFSRYMMVHILANELCVNK